MPLPLTAAAAADLVLRALGAAWARTPLGAPASTAPETPAGAAGWLVTTRVSGVATGSLVAWFEREGAIACAARILGLESAASDEAVAPVLMELVAHANAAIESNPATAGVLLGEPVVQAGPAPASLTAVAASWADGLACRFGAFADLATAAATDNASLAADGRLDAVLDVELPLVVRFGRTVMPLRAVSDLSPGSVVDMGRSPDDPVELLVGERLIARGEVVIVGGNYGVRITELTSGRRATDLETR